MDNIVDVMNDVRKLKPYIPNTSKNKLLTVSMYCVIIAASISIFVIMLGISNVYVFPLPSNFKLIVLILLVIGDILAIISTTILTLYSIVLFFCKLRKGKDVGYFSEEAFLYDFRNIKDLDKKYKEDILQFALTWTNSVIKRYEERIKVFCTTFSISSLIVVISFFSKPIVKTALENWGLISFIIKNHNILLYGLIMFIAFIIGIGLGTFVLRIKMLEYKYKIAIVEMTILRKTSKEKQTYFYQKS